MADSRRILSPWKVSLAYASLCALFAAVLWVSPAVRTYQLWEVATLQTAWGVAALAVVAAVWAGIGLRQGRGRVQRLAAGSALVLAIFSLGVAGYLLMEERRLLDGPQQFVEAEAEQVSESVSADGADYQ